MCIYICICLYIDGIGESIIVLYFPGPDEIGTDYLKIEES